MTEVRDDYLLHDLLKAQKPPKKWALYRTQIYDRHPFSFGPAGHRTKHCAFCGLPVSHKGEALAMRVIWLLTNGPLRRLTVLTRDEAELTTEVRSWLHTMYNLAEVAGSRIDGFIAYDAQG